MRGPRAFAPLVLLAAGLVTTAVAARPAGPGGPTTARPVSPPASADAGSRAESGERIRARGRMELRYGGIISTWSVSLLSALPAEEVRLEATLAGPAGDATLPGGSGLELEAEAGSLRRTGPAAWSWTAPSAPGRPIRLVLRDLVTGDSSVVQAFVLRPAAEAADGRLGGYRIGTYPERPLEGLEIYRAPRGFIEVTPANAETRVSPHFRLRDFLCKQEGGWPKYVALDPKLLHKLESLVERAAAHGVPEDAWVVMSGYRTPWYNAAIGNVRYSRHVFGAAADVFVDAAPRDGRMDDVNGDGRVDEGDARFLASLIDDLAEEPGHAELTGGLGTYGANASHGPFLHLDVRHREARW